MKNGTTTTFTISYDSMNRISGYGKTITEIGMPPQFESWNFYYGITGIDKVIRVENGIPNLSIDYTTDMNSRILGASYNETGGFSGNLTYVYDNYSNVSDLVDDDGNISKAVLIDPNSAEITRYHDPYDIDDPFTYRARQGFIGIGDLWAGDNSGTVYMQGHLVIPNDWGNVSTNGETTTTTDDTTEKDGGDKEGDCEDDDECSRLYSEWYRDYSLWKGWRAAKRTFKQTGQILIPTFTAWGKDDRTGEEGYSLEVDLFATKFFKEIFGEDYQPAVEEMYDEKIQEYLGKWLNLCSKMYEKKCNRIPDECWWNLPA